MILMKLFAQNPFRSLQEHMEKTMECVAGVRGLFDALFNGDRARVTELAKVISKLEHECDIIKQEMRGHLRRSAFLPVDRRDILHVLSHMDNIANSAEDLGVLLTMRWMEMPDAIRPTFDSLLSQSLDVVEASSQVIEALGVLFETGFSGPDADRVLDQIDAIDRLEHESDKAQDDFGKALFANEDDFKPAALFMWIQIAKTIGELANSSERMVNNIRTMLATK